MRKKIITCLITVITIISLSLSVFAYTKTVPETTVIYQCFDWSKSSWQTYDTTIYYTTINVTGEVHDQATVTYSPINMDGLIPLRTIVVHHNWIQVS